MAHLILVRHSVTRQEPLVSSHEWLLTDEGRSKCAVLAQQIKPYGVTLVASSSETKARITAALLAEHLKIGTEPIDEPDFGETRRDSAPYYDDPTEFSAAIRTAMLRPKHVVFGEEAFGEARVRFTRGLSRLVTTFPEQTIAVVTHGTIMSLVLAYTAAIDPYRIWEKLGMPAYAVFTPNLDLLDLQYTIG